MSRQFTDRFFDHFTDRALGICAEEDNFLLFFTLDIDPSPPLKFGPSPWSQNESERVGKSKKEYPLRGLFTPPPGWPIMNQKIVLAKNDHKKFLAQINQKILLALGRRPKKIFGLKITQQIFIGLKYPQKLFYQTDPENCFVPK